MKKCGFTLIELLAVIVILAIITLIATPMIMDVIEKSKRGAAIESVNGILDAAETYLSEKLIDQASYETEINLTGDTLTYKGSKPVSGTLIIGEKGKMYVIAKYGNYCIEKGFNDDSPKVIDREDCEIDVDLLNPKIYGVKRSLTAESSAWERTGDSVGLIANAQVGTTTVQNDFDSIYPWSEIKSYNYNTETNTITAWYGEDNFQFDGSNGEVLTYIPEFYYRRYQDDEYEYISISEDYQEGYIKSEAFSVGRYTISGTANDVHSKSGVTPLVSTTITDFRTYARQLGSEFGIMDYHYFILQLLYLVEYADYNSQAKLGLGYTVLNESIIQSGGCDTLGMYSGSIDNTGKTSVIYRGIEDIFGNIWQFIDGINIKDNQAYICYNQSEYVSDKFDGCYERVGYVNASSDGWISKLGYDVNHPLITFPIETIGANNTYVSDYCLQLVGEWEKVAFVGGNMAFGDRAGLWIVNLGNRSSLVSFAVGSRLLKIS